MSSDPHSFRKVVVFLVACMMMAFGVVLSTKAVLGTSPISSVPYVVSQITVLSLGTATLILNFIFIAMQVAVMGRMFRLSFLSQILMMVMFSLFSDMFSILMVNVHFDMYIVQWAIVVIAAAVLALGISLELAANVSMLAGEYLVSFIALRTHVDFGRVKIIFDITMITVAIILSVIFLGTLNGVREGTIFAALAVGPMVRFFTKTIKSAGFYEWVGHKDITTEM